MKFLLGLIAFVIIVPVAAIGFFILTFDANAFKTQVTQQVSTAIGREVVVAGPVDFSMTNGFSLGLKDVTIGNPQGFPDKNFAKVGTLFVSLNWGALLVRKVDVSEVRLADATVALMTNSAGQNNWDFNFGEKQPVEAQPGHKPEENMVDEVKQAVKEGRKPDFSVNSIALNNVELKNTTLTQVDMRTGKRQEFSVETAQLKIPASGSFHGDGKGKINGAAFNIRLDTKKSLREVKEGTPIPLDLSLTYAGQDYDLKGDLTWKGKVYRLADFKAKVMGTDLNGDITADMGGAIPNVTGSVSSPSIDLTKITPPKMAANDNRSVDGKLLATPIAASSASAAPDLSVLKSFNSDVNFTTARLVVNPQAVFTDVNTRIKVSSGTLTLAPLKAVYGGSAWTGNLTVVMQGGIPYLKGDLNAPVVDLTKLAPQKAVSAPSLALISEAHAAAAPDLSALRMFNADLDFATTKLVLDPKTTLGDVSTHIKVQNGALMLNPLKLTYNGLPLNGLASVDASQNIRAAFKLNNVNFDQLAKSFGSTSPVHSSGDVNFDLSGRGLDPQAFMSTMSGTLEMISGAGAVDWNGADGLGGAMVKALVPNSATQKPQLTCAVARFNANNGVLTSNGLLLESNYATVGGSGTVNLKDQSLNMVLRPVPKGATTLSSLTTATPIRVTGKLTSPSYVPEADAILQKALGGLTSPGQKISTGVPMVNASAGGNPCLAALNNPQMIMVEPPKTEQILKDVRDTVKDNFKNVRDIVKDPQKGLGELLKGKIAPQPAAQQPAAQQPAVQQPNAQPVPAQQAPANNNQKAIDALKGLLGR